jgi:guanylate kinase
VVTATDRAPRDNEVDGVHYCFFTTAEFQRMIAAGELLEWALVYEHHKGIPTEHVRRALAAGLDVLVRVDAQGAATIMRKLPPAITVFLTCESEEEMIRRLRGRHTESEEDLQKRIREARAEMARIDEFDYVVVNRRDGLDAAVDDMAAIIRAAQCRTQQGVVRL